MQWSAFVFLLLFFLLMTSDHYVIQYFAEKIEKYAFWFFSVLTVNKQVIVTLGEVLYGEKDEI